MNFTKNEKKVLKLLLVNSRISDTEIANNLKISSQAVGKIRRKLEQSVVESYGINLNYSKLGIQTFALALSKLNKSGQELGELEIEQLLLENPHVAGRKKKKKTLTQPSPASGRGQEGRAPLLNPTPIVTPAPVPGSTLPHAQRSSLNPHASLPVDPGTRPG